MMHGARSDGSHDDDGQGGVTTADVGVDVDQSVRIFVTTTSQSVLTHTESVAASENFQDQVCET